MEDEVAYQVQMALAFRTEYAPAALEPTKTRIPTKARYCTRNQNELVPRQEIITKLLLAPAGKTGPQPVLIGDRCRLDDVYT